MKKILGILGVIIMSLFLGACSGVSASDDNNNFHNENIIFTTHRGVFVGDFIMSSFDNEVLYTRDSRYYTDIAFTRFLTRNKTTGETEVLFQIKRDVKDFYFINGKFYLLTPQGIFTCDKNGENLQLIVEGGIGSFAVNNSSIFYSKLDSDARRFHMMKSDLDGSNSTVIAENISATKLTIVEGGIVFSDGGHVGKISDNNQVDTFITNLVIPMPGGEMGTHFVVNDKIIVTRYISPGEGKYGDFSTLILDLDGNVIAVWKTTIVHNIQESNGRIYAHISNVDERGNVQKIVDEYGNSQSDIGIHYISNDFKEIHLVARSFGFRLMYIHENNIFLNSHGLSWQKGDILRDGTIENLTDEPISVEYVDNIEVLVMNSNPIGEAPTGGTQYRGELLDFDVHPVVKNDHVLVPVRRISEALGATVEWDPATKTTTIKKNNTELRLKIYDNILHKNDTEITLSASSEIINGQTFVPLQVISEGLDARVEWDEARKAIWIWMGM